VGTSRREGPLHNAHAFFGSRWQHDVSYSYLNQQRMLASPRNGLLACNPKLCATPNYVWAHGASGRKARHCRKAVSHSRLKWAIDIERVMELGKRQLWKRFKFGVGAPRRSIVTCGDSDLEKIITRPCLAIRESAHVQAQKMKRAKFAVVIYLRAQSG